MPQGLSIVTFNPPPAPRNQPSSPSNDSGASRFDYALVDAQEGCATGLQAGRHVQIGRQNRRAGKTKPGKRATGKAHGKGRMQLEGDDPAAHDSQEIDEKQPDDVMAHAPSQEPTPETEIAREKPAPHADSAHADAQTPQPGALQIVATVAVPAAPLKSEQASSANADQPLNQNAPVQAVSSLNDPSIQPSQYAQSDAATATEKATAQVETEKPGSSALKPKAGKATGETPPTPAFETIQPVATHKASSPASTTAPVTSASDDEDSAASSSTDSAKAGAPPQNPSPVAQHAGLHTFAEMLAAQGQTPPAVKLESSPAHAAAQLAPLPPEVQFAENNHGKIVSSVHTQLLPNGGTMQIRLDPPDMGTMSVSVHMRDGVMSATFETSTDQASRLLSHSLGQLKTALESQGVSVGAIHVQQRPAPCNRLRVTISAIAIRAAATPAPSNSKNTKGGKHFAECGVVSTEAVIRSISWLNRKKPCF